MAPTTQNLLSPAELAYLHSSLSLTPPVRPDARSPTQFRPLIAETDILPGTNGSARICFADGTEAVVGVKAEVEKTASYGTTITRDEDSSMHDEQEHGVKSGQSQWVDMTIEIPGFRDDDSLPVFLAAILHEALVAGGDLARKLYINSGWHWRLYVDVLLLSPPLSYPVPLLSLTTHLALLSTRLPALKSEQDEDPFFNDDWDAATYIYPQNEASRPPITLLIASVNQNILFDPTREEIAVADALLAIALAQVPATAGVSGAKQGGGELRLLSVRTIDSPSRVTPAGVSDAENTKVQPAAGQALKEAPVPPPAAVTRKSGGDAEEGLWRPPRGGMPRTLVPRAVEMCLASGGVGEEVLAGLQSVDIG